MFFVTTRFLELKANSIDAKPTHGWRLAFIVSQQSLVFFGLYRGPDGPYFVAVPRRNQGRSKNLQPLKIHSRPCDFCRCRISEFGRTRAVLTHSFVCKEQNFLEISFLSPLSFEQGNGIDKIRYSFWPTPEICKVFSIRC